jgi:uncharacterized protein (TIGR02145 family)
MAENLNYATASNSWCYDNTTSNCNAYGRLYEWNTAMTACPSGWRLPDRYAWDDLVLAAGGSGVAGKALKTKSGWSGNGNGDDPHGFSALPGGTRNGYGTFVYIVLDGHWWTSFDANTRDAQGRTMRYNQNSVSEDYFWKTDGRSIRCVQD